MNHGGVDHLSHAVFVTARKEQQIELVEREAIDGPRQRFLNSFILSHLLISITSLLIGALQISVSSVSVQIPQLHASSVKLYMKYGKSEQYRSI